MHVVVCVIKCSDIHDRSAIVGLDIDSLIKKRIYNVKATLRQLHARDPDERALNILKDMIPQRI